LKQIRDSRRNTNNYSSCNYLFQTTSPNHADSNEKSKKQKKLNKGFSNKVDLTKSLNLTADTHMNMNGMGVYMNVIRESENVSKKKEML
jgi:hypothetical protein